MNTVEMHGFNGSISYAEAKGLSVVFEAYAENCSREDIMEIGFNPNSGYVYIALENGISICSMLGHAVEFLVSDDWGKETFCDEYELALNIL